jgi:hypothetical protein
VPGLIALLAGTGFALFGVRLLRNKDGRGGRWVERTTPERFRAGGLDTHRKVVGWGYVTFGVILLGFAIRLLASL